MPYYIRMPHTADEIDDQKNRDLMSIIALSKESITLKLIDTQERMTIFYNGFYKYYDIMVNLKTLAFGEYIFEDDEIEFIKDCMIHYYRNCIRGLERKRTLENFDHTYEDIKSAEQCIKTITKHANCMYNNKHQRFKNWFNLIEPTSPRYFMVV